MKYDIQETTLVFDHTNKTLNVYSSHPPSVRKWRAAIKKLFNDRKITPEYLDANSDTINFVIPLEVVGSPTKVMRGSPKCRRNSNGNITDDEV